MVAVEDSNSSNSTRPAVPALAAAVAAVDVAVVAVEVIQTMLRRTGEVEEVVVGIDVVQEEGNEVREGKCYERGLRLSALESVRCPPRTENVKDQSRS